MPAERYFVIRANDDGETRVEQYEKDELLTRLAEGYWGEAHPMPRFPDNTDPCRWFAGSLLIIRGEVVVPRAKEVVTRWDI